MTVFQSLAIKILMLAITVGIIYWGVSAEDQQPTGADQQQTRAPEPSTMSGGVGGRPEEPSPRHDPSPEADPKTTIVGESSASGDPAPSGDRKVAVLAPAEPAPSPSVRRTKSFPATPARRPVRFPIDLNKAPMHDLLELPGIGEKLAERIVQYRKDHGPFQSSEDLRKVKGIGKKRMERLRPLVITTGVHD